MIVTPAQYPTGLEIPVIARVEDASGHRVGVNGSITAPGFEDRPLQLLARRRVGLSARRRQARYHLLHRRDSLAGDSQEDRDREFHELADSCRPNITSSTNWGENARIRLAPGTVGALRVAAGATLTIGSGSVIVVDPDVEIIVDGRLVVNGTLERPVVFTCRDRKVPWGGFVFEKSTSRGDFTGTILTGSGADPSWFDNNPGHGGSHRHNQCLFYLSNGANVTLTDCWLVDNHGQAGHGEKAYLTMTRCLVQKCITAGQYNGGALTLEDCALIEFPSATAPYADADNDGLYLTGGVHLLTDCLIGWSLDDGIDAGGSGAGSVTVRHCWFESSYHEAMAWSGTQKRTAIDSVALNCGQGYECGYEAPDVNTVHCLSTANVVGARFGDNYDWTYEGFLNIRDSLLLFNHRDIWGRAWDNWTVAPRANGHSGQLRHHPRRQLPEQSPLESAGRPESVGRIESLSAHAGRQRRHRYRDAHRHRSISRRLCERDPRASEHLHDQGGERGFSPSAQENTQVSGGAACISFRVRRSSSYPLRFLPPGQANPGRSHTEQSGQRRVDWTSANHLPAYKMSIRGIGILPMIHGLEAHATFASKPPRERVI